MLRVIFDTNIYGKIVDEKDFESIATKIKTDDDFKVYGFDLIRKELRDTPKTEKLGKLSKRNLLLNLYDGITSGRYLKDSLQIHKIAMKFYNSYREFGGIRNWDKTKINIDFTIVACATFYKLDVVVSDDSKTMLSKPALKAFKHICVKEGFWHPNFWKYSDLRTRYGF